jgi:hypothetical protein
MTLHNLILWHPILLSVLLAGWLMVGILCLGLGIWLRTITQEGGVKAYRLDLITSLCILFLLIWLFQDFFDVSRNRPRDIEFHVQILESADGP